jgi:hypothetical protein
MPYTPKIDGSVVRTLAEWGAFFKEDGKPYDIIELMNQTNTILDDILWREATDYDGHRTSVRDGLPSVYWRRLYRGTPPSKSSVSVIKDPVGMLEARCIIDAKLLEIHQSQAKAYRIAEARAFMEAMRQELATALFYGNIKGNPDGIHGLDPRYCYSNAPQVVDAGGDGSENTSIWGLVWGENDATGIFPRDSIAGLQHKDLGESDAYDEAGNAFRALCDLYSWNIGFSMRDWRSVARICNIPVASLELAKGDTGFIDLHRLTIKAKNMIPPEKRTRMKWYMNQEVLTALELQATDAGNVTLVYRKEDAGAAGPLFKSHTVTELHGCDIRQCDSILSTEQALAAL